MKNFSNKIEEYYDNLAYSYDDYYRDNISLAEDFLIKKSLLNFIEPDSNVLDCGCGTGLAKAMLSKISCNYTGIDLSSKMLEVAKKKHPSGNFIHGDITNMEYLNSGCYDNIISLNGSFSHVINYNDAINEFMRLLKPGGNLFLMVYSRYSIKRVLNGKFLRTIDNYNIRNSSISGGTTSPAFFWSISSLKREFCSFRNVNIKGLNITADVFKKSGDLNSAISILEKEMKLPLFFQNLSHALIIKAKK